MPRQHTTMKPPKPKPLNARQERFAQLIAQGLPASHAYVEAGYAKDRQGARANSCYLMKVPRMAARIAEIRSLAASLEATLMTIVEKRRFLAESVRTPAGSIGRDSWLCQEFQEKRKTTRTTTTTTTTKAQTKTQTQTTSPPADATTADSEAHTELEGHTRRETELLWRWVKTPDKLRAIALDSKLAGHFPSTAASAEGAKAQPPAITLQEIQKIAERVKIVSPLLREPMLPPAPPSAQ